MRSRSLFSLLAVVGLAALLLTACGGSSKKSSGSTTTSSAGASGGTFNAVANKAPSGSPDPQINYTLQEWQLLIFSHDGLIAFKRAGGTEGTKIVPDLATSVPKPTDGGKTYTFTIRKGIKFSNGKELKPSDVKYTFLRLFKIKQSPNAGSWYNVIVGGDACVKSPDTCNLDQGVIADDSKGTVTFHLTRGDPEFLDKLAVPFAFILPTGTPNHEVQIPPPGTGPYKWVTYNPNKELKLVRNTYFKEWSKDAQPNGKPDVIVEKLNISVEGEVTQVENGTADWMFDTPPADRLNEMSTKYANQVYVNPLTAVYYFAFNVRIPPFNNLKARQAVNYATDRNALVKIYGGPKLATPTCQVLPPNFPGYKPYCPYTANPESGKWTAPDMAKAKQLVQESGTAGTAVKVNSDTTEVDKAYGEYFVDLLNKLGYKATPQFLSNDIQYPYVQNSKNKVNFAYSSWFADYPAASDFLNILLGCDSFHPNSNSSPNIAEFCDKTIQSSMTKASQTSITNPTQGNAIWQQVDKNVADAAPWVAMFNPKELDFVSKRFKNFTFSPQWLLLL